MTCHHICKPDARFCPKCGTSFAAAVPTSMPAALTEDDTTIAVMPAPAPPIVIAPEKQSAAVPLPVAPEPVIAAALPTAPPAPPAPVITPPPVPPLTMPSPATPSPPTVRSGKQIGLLVLAAVAGIAVLAGGGYFAMRTAGTSSPATPSASAVIAPGVPGPTAQPVSPAGVNIPTPVTTTPAEKLQPVAPAPVANTPEPPEVVTGAMPYKPAPVVPAKAKPMPVPKAPPAATNSGLDQVINDSLAEATQCMNRKQFDCVIANTSTVLRMAPDNRRAQDMKRQAKQAQERALSQIQIQ
jgi:hypothetical protein